MYICLDCVSKVLSEVFWGHDNVCAFINEPGTSWLMSISGISSLLIKLTENERIWLHNSNPERYCGESSEFAQLKLDVLELKQDTKSFETLRESNKTLQKEMGKLKDENNVLSSKVEELKSENNNFKHEIEQTRRENLELKEGLEQMRKEMKNVQSLLINFEQPQADRSQDDVLLQQMDKQHTENAELKAQFDEFELCNQIIEDVKCQQEKVKQDVKSIEEKHGEDSNSLEKQIEELQNQIDNFVTETKSDLNERKSQLIQQMKRSIFQLQSDQKLLVDKCRDLQQQNTTRSKVLQNKLELTKHKFNDTVQMKNSLMHFYGVSLLIHSLACNIFLLFLLTVRVIVFFQTEGDAALRGKNSEGLEKSDKFGSNSSLSTTASSFERIPDQEL